MRTTAHTTQLNDTALVRTLADEAQGWFAVVRAEAEHPQLSAVFAEVERALRDELSAASADHEAMRGAMARANDVVYGTSWTAAAAPKVRLSASVVVIRGADAVVGHIGTTTATVVRHDVCSPAPLTTPSTGRRLGDWPHVDAAITTVPIAPGDRIVLATGTVDIDLDGCDDGARLASGLAGRLAKGSPDAAVMVIDAVGLLALERGEKSWLRFARHPLARTLGPEDLAWLHGLATRHHLAEGEVLVRGGDPIDAVLLLAEGALRVDSSSGIERWGAGTVHHMDVWHTGPRTSDRHITAAAPSVVLTISHRTWQQQQFRHPVRVARVTAKLWRARRGRAQAA